jgi:glycosyltransferase involved in cell wall biosynthesis
MHVLGLPQIGTTRDYWLCGFCPKIMLFCRMMKELGHTVILYTSEENEVQCDEVVTVITKAEQAAYLKGTPFIFAPFKLGYAMWDETNKRMAAEIARRKQPRDFICTVGGVTQKPVTDAHPDLMAVEIGVGYEGIFAPYVVFESHSWRQYLYGKYGTPDGRFFDTVIPNYFDPEDFPLVAEKQDYLLYAGRITPRKGIAVAIETAQRSGLPLRLVGPATPADLRTCLSALPAGCEYLGVVSKEERTKLMGEARAVLMPTLYNEPFGSVAIEANLSGTPLITTDYGSFPEIIQNGVNGYRANLLREFVSAVKLVGSLDPAGIRGRAVAKYSIEAVKPLYAAYFDKIATLWGQGWYAA